MIVTPGSNAVMLWGSAVFFIVQDGRWWACRYVLTRLPVIPSPPLVGGACSVTAAARRDHAGAVDHAAGAGVRQSAISRAGRAGLVGLALMRPALGRPWPAHGCARRVGRRRRG